MKTPEHTPAPWIITHDPNGSAAEGAAEGLTVIIEREDYERADGESGARHIAFCFGAGPPDNDDLQAVADYHLIAAAPDLLAALKAVTSHGEGMPGWADAQDQAHAAIAKAEGRER